MRIAILISALALVGCVKGDSSKKAPPSSSAESSPTPPPAAVGDDAASAARPTALTNVFAVRPGAASCTLSSNSSCTEYEGPSAERERACRLSRASYSPNTGCPREKLVGACHIKNSMNVDFYYEGAPMDFTRENVKRMCPERSGTFFVAP